jgi:segregation and condensation protein B
VSVIRAEFRQSKDAAETPAEAQAEPRAGNEEALRLLEALLFASAEPLDEASLKRRLPDGASVKKLLEELRELYAPRGVNIVKVENKWVMRTAPDLGPLLAKETGEPKKLSRAAVETLAIVAYHQPVTRAEIEDIRGVTISKGTLGRRKAPGRPVTYGTTDEFLLNFGIEAIDDLPGLEELKGAGFLEGRLPAGFSVPMPSDDVALRDDEEPLEEDLDLGLSPRGEQDESEPGAEEGEPSATREPAEGPSKESSQDQLGDETGDER